MELVHDDGLREVACTAWIVEVLEEMPDGRSNILVRGEGPVRLVEVREVHSYSSALAEDLAGNRSAASPLQ